ncbi:hypothetical protein TSUD_235130 [Trifolium subterraneum]|uniref:Uncharacterized protein n=1 Tax=Trifolium subterraneum TaxID=3900 RepID=A0A2Z6LTP8_TRISU|nr:hypothetical protein TSUD_235130 [Trifolium subterraneum]
MVATSPPSSPKLVNFIHHTHAPYCPKKSLRLKKYTSMYGIMVRVGYTVFEKVIALECVNNVGPLTNRMSCCCATNVKLNFI